MDNSDVLNINNKNEKISFSFTNNIGNTLSKNKLSFDNNLNSQDIRDEQNDFLKQIFRKFKKSNIKFKNIINKKTNDEFKDKQYIEENIKNDKKRKKNNFLYLCFNNENVIPSFNEQFPVILLKNMKIESIGVRFLIMFLSITISFFCIGIKTTLANKFDLATYCDLKSDWKEFDNLVKNKTIVMFQEQRCQDYCDFIGYLISKLFHFDFFIATISNFYCFYKNFNLLNRRSVKLFLIVFPLGCNILSNIIFFKNKIIAYLSFSFLSLFGVFVLIYESKNIFFISALMALPIGYFAILKFFFEYLFVYVYYYNANAMRIILPLLICIFKFIYFRIILSWGFLQRLGVIHKFSCCMFTILFDFIYIGNLHLLVENGFSNYTFWINLMLNLVMDLNTKFQIIPKMYSKIKNSLLKMKNKQHQVSDFERIYIAFSVESEIYV